MSKEKYGLVTQVSFINGGLQEPGTVIPNYGGPYGEGIKESDKDGNLIDKDAPKPAAKPAQAQAPKPASQANQQDADEQPRFEPKHNGGGRFIVIDNEADLVDGKQVKVGDFTGTRDEAQVEADRLIAGGEPFKEEAEQEDDNLPDA